MFILVFLLNFSFQALDWTYFSEPEMMIVYVSNFINTLLLEIFRYNRFQEYFGNFSPVKSRLYPVESQQTHTVKSH